MKTTKIALILLSSGGLFFTSCQSNNKPVAQRADTAATVSYNDNMGSNTGAGVSPATGTTTTTVPVPEPPTTATPVAAAANSILVDTTEYVCIPRHRQAPVAVRQRTGRSHVVAYNKWRKHRKSAVTTETETDVATVTEPTAPLENITKEPETTVPAQEPIVYEKPNEFTGNVMPAPKKRSKVHLAPEVGFNLNNFYKRSEDFQTSNQLKAGFNGGVMMDVEIGKRWAYQTGVKYIMKGAEMTSTSTNGPITTEHKEKITLHYVEMPMSIVYNTGDWGTSHVFVGAGPYISYLVNAQDKTKDKVSGPDGEIVNQGQHQMATGNPDNGKIRNYDAGAQGFIGYQMSSGVYVKAGAEAGLLDLQKNTNLPDKFYNRNYNFLFSVGYLCGYKK